MKHKKLHGWQKMKDYQKYAFFVVESIKSIFEQKISEKKIFTQKSTLEILAKNQNFAQRFIF